MSLICIGNLHFQRTPLQRVATNVSVRNTR
nr:MAG TPA: hypothetical protein [Caudoviricetes sp.]